MNIVIITFNIIFILLYIIISVFKTKIANEQVINNFVKEFVYFEDKSERSSGQNRFTGMMHFVVYRPDLGSLSIPPNL